MKATDLNIGQKYIWRRNSDVSHEVTYIGCSDSGKFPMYEFEYIKEGEKMQTLLSVHHVNSDITQLKEITDFSLIQLGCELYGLHQIRTYLLENGYNKFAWRKSSRPTQGSPIYNTTSLSNEKVKSKIYRPKQTKLAGQTIVLKTEQGYCEFYK